MTYIGYMQKPPSILHIDHTIVDGVDSYEAYVYKYTNTINGRMYIGSRKGLFDGTYWHSSKNTEFLRVFSGPDPVLNLQIINFGFYLDMQNLENQLQSEVNARSNPLYYNDAVAPTGNKQPIDIEKCKQVVEYINDRIENGEYGLEDKEEVSKLERLQIRKEDDSKHIADIRDRMRETGLKDSNPVIIWEGCGVIVKGNDLMGDGNHTLRALEPLKNITQIKTLRIPKEFIEEWDLNYHELEYIGGLLNPIAKIPTKDHGEEDAIKKLVTLMQEGVVLDGDRTTYGKDLLKGYGFTSRKATAILKKAKDKHKELYRSQRGEKIARYDKDHKSNLKKLEIRADSLRNNHTIVVTGCTAYLSKIWREISECLIDETYKDRYSIELVYFHNTDDNKDKWENGEHAALKRIVNGMLKLMGPIKIKDGKNIIEMERTFNTHPMDHVESDVTLEGE